jgi:hypothetical protein
MTALSVLLIIVRLTVPGGHPSDPPIVMFGGGVVLHPLRKSRATTIMANISQNPLKNASSLVIIFNAPDNI